MTSVLQIGHSTFTAEEIIPLLVGYQIVPQLICENIIDQAIAPIQCTPQETAQAGQEFYQRWGLTYEDRRQAWRSQYGLSQEQLERMVTRKLRVEKFKQATWGQKLDSYFLKRKGQLDRVIYSLIRTKDKGIANELYFRINEGEQSFAQLARAYSEGPEAETGGLMGPVELGTLHPTLAQLLHNSPVGQVQPPVPLGEWQVIRRVEKLIPAQLDDFMRQRLLQENFEAWFKEQLNQLSQQEQMWMGATARHQVDTINNLAAAQ
jgi:parvulin-like peptidyl-prolyl isomerase